MSTRRAGVVREDARVTPLERFFDPVFVYAITRAPMPSGTAVPVIASFTSGITRTVLWALTLTADHLGVPPTPPAVKYGLDHA